MGGFRKRIEDFLVPFVGPFAYVLVKYGKRYAVLRMRRRANIHPTVRLGDVELDSNVTIGEHTYYQSGQILAGEHGQVTIGKYCAIGYNVRIKARDHNPMKPTATEEGPLSRIEADIRIGDYAWIGDNVFIKHGVNIGDNMVIGANSVVTKDIPDYMVAGGVPARILYDKRERQ